MTAVPPVTRCLRCRKLLRSMSQMCPGCALDWNAKRRRRERQREAGGLCVDCGVAPVGVAANGRVMRRCEACAFRWRVGRGHAP